MNCSGSAQRGVAFSGRTGASIGNVRRARRRGFTLLELVVVMFILSLITMFAMPSFMGFFRETEAQQTASDLVQVLRFAHQEAIFKREPRTVGIDFETNAYFVRGKPREGDYSYEQRKEHLTPLPEDFDFEEIYFAQREEREDSDVAYFSFYANGTADKIKLTINRYDEGGFADKVYIVRVNETTGHIKVKEREEDEDNFF